MKFHITKKNKKRFYTFTTNERERNLAQLKLKLLTKFLMAQEII